MTASSLLLLHDEGSIAGTLEQSEGRTTLRYESAWRQRADAVALSVSLPLSRWEHAHDRVDPFLWGLLPDNEIVLERWGRLFQVSSRNAFRLLTHVGEDCPGAFQLVPAERHGSVREEREGVQWLTAREVEQRLAAIRIDPSQTRTARDKGQFSLAGAQPKIALHRDGARWGVPFGRTPTTHILKPPGSELDGFAENEHFCLRLAQRVGLPAARSEVLRFGAEVAIVVERFDRTWTGGRSVLRLHQEDLCQALAVHPTRKYQNEGGPTPRQIVELLRAASSRAKEDVETFVDALALQWILGGTDAHAKNYSLLHGGRGSLRLAPLYDLASALPYPHLPQRRLKLAMSLSGEYGMHAIRARHVSRLALELRLDETETSARFRALAEAVAREAPALAKDLRGEGLEHPIVGTLSTAIARRAAQCVKWLGE